MQGAFGTYKRWFWFVLLLAGTQVWWPEAGLAEPLEFADQFTPASQGEMKDHRTTPDMRIWCGLILWEFW